MPALPLVTSGAGALLVSIVLMVVLAALVGAVIGVLANRSHPTPLEDSAEWADSVEHLHKAA